MPNIIKPISAELLPLLFFPNATHIRIRRRDTSNPSVLNCIVADIVHFDGDVEKVDDPDRIYFFGAENGNLPCEDLTQTEIDDLAIDN